MNTDQLLEALDSFFSDTSRSPDQTRDGLAAAIDHAQMLMESIQEDEET